MQSIVCVSVCVYVTRILKSIVTEKLSTPKLVDPEKKLFNVIRTDFFRGAAERSGSKMHK
jgi:hypothetical protein